jgi:hypothetical protein
MRNAYKISVGTNITAWRPMQGSDVILNWTLDKKRMSNWDGSIQDGVETSDRFLQIYKINVESL